MNYVPPPGEPPIPFSPQVRWEPPPPYDPRHSYLPPPLLKPNWPLHIGLFVATAIATWLTAGPLYAASIMSILLAHEMGHYLTARYYRGTMGAVIRMATMGANRKLLFDIAVAGPIAGMVLAVPACVIGLKLSRVVDVGAMSGPHVNLGTSILFQWFSDVIVGPLGPGKDIELHPIAFAGWAGLFVTSLNLIPVGQLDGGHVAYALLGRRAHLLAIVVALAFIALAIFVSWSWVVLAAMVAFFGLRHPPTGDDSTPIGTPRLVVGVALLLLFALTFTPRPFE
ncbi:MAG: putative peptidase M50 [bacterium]|nr:MAG: putative peptidase M50 [bacterium]